MAVGGALFGNSRGGGTGGSGSKAVVEFRAGKMTMSGNLVTADKRKGLIQVEQGEDTLMHFKWKDRGTGVVEDDLIIFPDDIEFVRVDQCKTGRVYLLKFKSSSRRMFFWMQEPKEDKDEELCKKVNDSLNKGAAAAGGGEGGRGSLAADLGSLGSALGLSSGGGRGGIDLSDSGIHSLLQNMSQQQLAQLFGGSMPSTPMERGTGGKAKGPRSSASRSAAAAAGAATASATTTPTGAAPSAATPAAPTKADKDSSSSQPAAAAAGASGSSSSNVPIQLTDLQSVLSGIRVPEGMEGALGGAAGGSKEPAVDLSVGLTGTVVTPLLTNPDFVSKMKKLLPAGEQEEAAGDEGAASSSIDSTIKSPQFKQAVQMFSSGLQSGQLAPLIREFDLGDEAVAAAAAGNLEAFVKAIEKKSKDAKKSGGDDDEMGGLD